ncbi:hypothetical protein [Lamprocystis purpurea]|uniref:hypothetical protein n=1 Tax=Lamprocystis purpurea TaxID=61598 RepID=UPI001B7FDB4F|nr:hypothetical protein [Lamprocystis purpurea]
MNPQARDNASGTPLEPQRPFQDDCVKGPPDLAADAPIGFHFIPMVSMVMVPTAAAPHTAATPH